MPIVALVFSTLMFWLVYWFFRLGGLEQLQAARAQQRIAKARASEHVAPLRAIDDPRDAAIVLMLLMARVDRDPTREHIAAVEAAARATFDFDRDLAERMTQARFIASRAANFEHATALFGDLFNKRLTSGEKLELVEMVRGIAKLEGPSEAQLQAIDVLMRRTGLAAAA
jgi:hypothetical protein